MKGLLNLRGISGQIAALVVVSIAALHLIITASFLLHRPDQAEPSSDRGHGQLAAAVQLLGAAPASERPRRALGASAGRSASFFTSLRWASPLSETRSRSAVLS